MKNDSQAKKIAEQIKSFKNTIEFEMFPLHNKIEFDVVKEASKQFQNIKVFYINNNGRLFYVIRKTEPIDDRVDLELLKISAFDDYYDKCYLECINKMLTIISMNELMYSPNIKLVGKCFNKLKEYNKANIYFMVADQINFSNEIQKTANTGTIHNCTKKDTNNVKRHANYDLSVPLIQKEKIELIIIDVVDNNDSFEEIVENYGLNKVEEQYIKIYIAKEYYKRGLPIQGDKYIKQVEQSENKNTDLIVFLESVKTNKKLYIRKAHN